MRYSILLWSLTDRVIRFTEINIVGEIRWNSVFHFHDVCAPLHQCQRYFDQQVLHQRLIFYHHHVSFRILQHQNSTQLLFLLLISVFSPRSFFVQRNDMQLDKRNLKHRHLYLYICEMITMNCQQHHRLHDRMRLDLQHYLLKNGRFFLKTIQSRFL